MALAVVTIPLRHFAKVAHMTLSSHMMQTSQQPVSQSTPAAPPSPAQARAQFKQDLKQQILDVTNAAKDAAAAAQDAKATRISMGIPGTILVPPTPPGYDSNNIIPPQAVDIAIGFFIMCAVMVVGWPLARAFGRRIERKSDTPAVNPAMSQQLQRIEQAVDAMSIEIERISESQRFMAKLQNGAAERVALPADRM